LIRKRSLFNLGGDPPSCTSGVPHPAAFVLVILLHRRCARLKCARVNGVDLRDIDVHVGRNRWPTFAAIRDHHHRIVNTDLGVHELTGRVGKPAQFDRIENAYEEVDRLASLTFAFFAILEGFFLCRPLAKGS
jgi:hypothetical protein